MPPGTSSCAPLGARPRLPQLPSARIAPGARGTTPTRLSPLPRLPSPTAGCGPPRGSRLSDPTQSGT
eukprot:8095914-Pyramimonas_sp.AAC.1